MAVTAAVSRCARSQGPSCPGWNEPGAAPPQPGSRARATPVCPRGARRAEPGGGAQSHVPTLSSLPKTVLSPRAEQFQRPLRNWNWHSLMPIWDPSPMTMIASGLLWQIARCRGASPGILLQMMLAPRATTEEKPLQRQDTGGG